MRTVTSLIVLLTLGGLSGCQIDRNDSQTAAAAKHADVNAVLNPIVPVVNFQNTTLEKAVDTLREQTHANIVVTWSRLADVGVDRTIPIDCHLSNVSLLRALETLATLVTPSCGTIVVRADRGVIFLATNDALPEPTETRVYDIRDLVEEDRKLHGRWEDTVPQPQQNDSQSNAATQPGTPWTGEQSFDDLKKTITDQVSPDLWRDAGGAAASMDDFNGKLVITAPSATHEGVAALLEKLRHK